MDKGEEAVAQLELELRELDGDLERTKAGGNECRPDGAGVGLLRQAIQALGVEAPGLPEGCKQHWEALVAAADGFPAEPADEPMGPTPGAGAAPAPGGRVPPARAGPAQPGAGSAGGPLQTPAGVGGTRVRAPEAEGNAELEERIKEQEEWIEEALNTEGFELTEENQKLVAFLREKAAAKRRKQV